MINLSEINRFYWVLFIISFLLPLISLPLPVAIFKVKGDGHFIINVSITIWGTYIGLIPDYWITGFIEHQVIRTVSNICAITIIFTSIFILISGYLSTRKKDKIVYGFAISWFTSAILFIGALISWLILIPNYIGEIMPYELRNHNFWNYLSLGPGFFIPIVSTCFIILGIFLYRNKFKIEELPSIKKRETIEMEKRNHESILFHIEDSFESSLYWSICCSITFIVFLLVTAVAIFLNFSFPQSLLAVLIIGGGIFAFIFKASKILKGTSRVRIFTVTNKKINIDIPNKPYFQINWNDIKIIEISKGLDESNRIRENYCRFRFKLLPGIYKDFYINLKKDFRPVSLQEIIDQLKEYSTQLNKEIIIKSRLSNLNGRKLSESNIL